MDKIQIKFFGVFVMSGIFLSVCMSGCSPEMRKKFIRERKTDDSKNEVIPVLDPVDYPNALENARTRYDYFYALLKVWHKDALMVLDDGASDKQMRYTLNQVKLQLQELKKVFSGPSLITVQNGITAVDEILAQYDRPSSLRNTGIIRGDIQRLEDSVIKPLLSDGTLNDLKESDE